MLDGPGYAAGNIHLGTHGLAGLSHLMGVGNPAGVHCCAGRSQDASNQVGQFL